MCFCETNPIVRCAFFCGSDLAIVCYGDGDKFLNRVRLDSGCDVGDVRSWEVSRLGPECVQGKKAGAERPSVRWSCSYWGSSRIPVEARFIERIGVRRRRSGDVVLGTGHEAHLIEDLLSSGRLDELNEIVRHG